MLLSLGLDKYVENGILLSGICEAWLGPILMKKSLKWSETWVGLSIICPFMLNILLHGLQLFLFKALFNIFQVFFTFSFSLSSWFE